MNYIPILLIAYLIGSFPTGFIVLKMFRGLDITKEGSGNVGTLNSFEVTNSKKIGILVLIIDLLKGILSVLITKSFFSNDFITTSLALNFAVLGHCYSPWIKFKGGRGLATAAGGTLFFSPMITFMWLFSWFIIKKIKNDIHIANIGATIITILSTIFLVQPLNYVTFPKAESYIIFIICISLMMIIILTKHIEPLKEIINKKLYLGKN